MTNEIRNDSWDADYDNVLLVGEYLVRSEGYSSEDLLHFFSKPWHYSDEYRKAVAWDREEDAAFEAAHGRGSSGGA